MSAAVHALVSITGPLGDPLRDVTGLPSCGPDRPRMWFGVRDSNGHERRAHGGLALDSHTRLLTHPADAWFDAMTAGAQVRVGRSSVVVLPANQCDLEDWSSP